MVKKEIKQNRRIWLKVGIGFFILSFLIIGRLSYGEYKSCSPDWSGMCGFVIGIFNLPMSGLLANTPQLSHAYDLLPDSIAISLLVLVSSIWWFFVGAAIGKFIEFSIKKIINCYLNR